MRIPVRPGRPIAVLVEVAVRNQVLNEVLDAFSTLGGERGMDDILKVVQGLKKKQQEQAEERIAAAEPVRHNA